MTETERRELVVDGLLKLHEAADLLGMSQSFVKKRIADGTLRRIKLGRATRVSRREVENLAIAGLEE